MKTQYAWYFLRIVALIVPWNDRLKPNPKGTPAKFSYLIKSRSLKSARNKANYLLSAHKSLEGTSVVKGAQVAVIPIGIVDLEQIQERIQDGVEIFEETDAKTTLREIRKTLVDRRALQREISKEARLGFLPIIPGWAPFLKDL